MSTGPNSRRRNREGSNGVEAAEISRACVHHDLRHPRDLCAALPSGPTLVRTSRDLLMSLLAIRRRWDGAIITAAFWMQDKREARLLCREVNAGFAHGSEGLLVANARDAQRRIENVAAHMGIMLTDNDIVLLRARNAVEFIDRRIDQLQAEGKLHALNRAYRAWRIAAKSEGRVMTYSEFRARLRKKFLQQFLVTECHRGSEQLLPPLKGLDFSGVESFPHARRRGPESAQS
jgi:hypothetical protein